MVWLQKVRQAFNEFCGMSFDDIDVKTILLTNFETSDDEVDASLTMKTSMFQSLTTDEGFRFHESNASFL